MMVNGDPSQIDLAPGQKSGLGDAIGLGHVDPRIGHVRFTHVDVVRHDLVRQMVELMGARASGAADRGQMKVSLDISVSSRLWRELPRAGRRAARRSPPQRKAQGRA